MTPALRLLFLTTLTSLPLMAETVVITSVPDEVHGLEPLTSLAGVPLAEGTEVLVGAFPGLSDDQVLDLASQGGLAQVTAAFVSFGDPCAIGEGVDGEAGEFEISVRDFGPATWVGETVSLLIRAEGGEFLVARFEGTLFEVETDTGLEPLLSLHLANAKLVVGSRYGAAKLATSGAPAIGSYETWLATYPTITDPALKLPDADADADGCSNFLEYATGGNPAISGDPPPCGILPDDEGGLWVRFNRVPGLGSIRYSLESSGDLSEAWLETDGDIEPDPESPAVMRLRLTPPLSTSGFFRLNVAPVP